MDTCATTVCSRWPIQIQMLPHGSFYEGSLTFPLVIHTDTHTCTSTPCSVIPVRALNYLCHNHSECCQASHCSEYIWLHYPATHGVPPRWWCAPTGRRYIWFHQIFWPPGRMFPTMCVHHQNNWHINSITVKVYYCLVNMWEVQNIFTSPDEIAVAPGQSVIVQKWNWGDRTQHIAWGNG